MPTNLKGLPLKALMTGYYDFVAKYGEEPLFTLISPDLFIEWVEGYRHTQLMGSTLKPSKDVPEGHVIIIGKSPDDRIVVNIKETA